jgi:hypothetical protein
MAIFVKAYLILSEVEFGDDPSKFLHTNKGEKGWTIGGIYELYNKDEIDWEFIRDILRVCNHKVKRASRILYADSETKRSVFDYFRKHYWDKILLDEVQDQSKANNIFLSAVHIGTRNAVKLAQKVAQVKQDGIVGQYTIKALNNYNETIFKSDFDKLEVSNYQNLIERNPNLEWARKGFLSRAYKV